MSRLSTVRPQGFLTGHVEALTSVVCATARAHALRTSSLLTYLATQRVHDRTLMLTFNGMSTYASRVAEALHRAGGADGLNLTTCLPWRQWLNPRGHTLLKQTRQWCPDCLANDRKEGRQAYQRLYWCLGSVSTCVEHRRLLSDRCPACGGGQTYLPRLPFMDHCGECGALLCGEPVRSLSPTSSQIWDSESTFELIATTHQSDGKIIMKGDLHRLVRELVGRLAGGSAAILAKLTDIERASIRGWSEGRTLPSLVQFVRFCRAVQCPPSALVTGHPLFIDPALIRPVNEGLLRAGRSRAANDFSELKKRLEALLEANKGQPISLREVARRLGRSVGILKFRYPETCRLIVARAAAARSEEHRRLRVEREQHLAEALEACARIGVYPSDRHLREVAGVRSSDLRRPGLRPLVLHARWRLLSGTARPNDSTPS